MRESTLLTRDGLTLAARTWVPEGPVRAAIALVHGLGEHSGRYDAVACDLGAAGYAVHAVDLRGHGRSPGARAYVARFDDYLNDVDALLAGMPASAPAKRFLMGHSMGGVVAVRYAAVRSPAVAGLVLSSPAFRLGAVVSPTLLALSRVLSRLVPRLRVARIDPELLARDPGVIEAYRTDPLCSARGTPVRTGAEMLRTAAQTLESAPALGLPLLLFHGSGDRLTDPDGSRLFHARYGGRDRTLTVYAGSRHETLNDLDRRQVITDLIAWLDAR